MPAADEFFNLEPNSTFEVLKEERRVNKESQPTAENGDKMFLKRVSIQEM